jgi:hypothetical protein
MGRLEEERFRGSLDFGGIPHSALSDDEQEVSEEPVCLSEMAVMFGNRRAFQK